MRAGEHASRSRRGRLSLRTTLGMSAHEASLTQPHKSSGELVVGTTRAGRPGQERAPARRERLRARGSDILAADRRECELYVHSPVLARIGTPVADPTQPPATPAKPPCFA
jgi:hypothetical protein